MEQEKKENEELSREEIRKEFLDAERERLIELKNDPKFRALVDKIKTMKEEDLYNLANSKIESIENGEVPEEELEKVETQILAIFTALESMEREHEKEIDKGDSPDDKKDSIDEELAKRRKRRSDDMER